MDRHGAGENFEARPCHRVTGRHDGVYWSVPFWSGIAFVALFRMKPFLVPLVLAPLVLVSVGGFTACSFLKRIPAPPLPKFSTLKKVTNIIPGLPKSDSVSADDPKMPFNARGTLGYGHTVRIRVHEGSRSPKRLYDDVRMVDTQGLLDLGGRYGQVRLGGLTLPQAVEALATTFRMGAQSSRTVSVQIVSVEDVPVVFVTGDVIKNEFIPAWDGMTMQQAVTVAGGRRLGSSARGVYLTREGVQRYYGSLEALNEREEPEPGDIITLSPDL